MYFLLLFFGVLAGVTTVLFGFGGGFVVVPVLYSVLLATYGIGSAEGHAAMHVAVATSTCVMIFGAGLATLRHHKAGTVPWNQVRPLLGYIAAGAVPGAAAALALSGAWVRWAFIVYLGLTILDSILRPGFAQEGASPIRTLGRRMTAVAGTAIGVIAAFLGVGGSVMTVPLMRRRGASMTAATAAANPLSLPMAVVGSATFAALAWNDTSLDAWHVGYIDLRACLVLTVGSWLGIWAASRWIGRIPDGIHVKAYIALLCVALLVMLVV
ncbi:MULTISPECIES: sulfite exporter TauE/SafE family protein [unclassified Pseudomonas]|uniref:sulfite exporter TauE/SafE family protein n=1 Tax=unclassified Pseudomonas TaxID=196821 RepID=UPI00215BF7D6|nr:MULTISPECIES: sulfite exporter TauE/SafE family protein [unclassified Pseudomonas]MCR8932276.1 sulfite exporter TauE/SafE family protein [Pseudomonas sp. S11A4]MCR8975883.1 sulfite exporter TauE/SafE family protein [Pseudomonas sp. S11P7]